MMAQFGYDQSVQFFHEQNDYEGQARIAFNFIQAHQPTKEPIGLTFIDKAQAVELQAADVLAYETNFAVAERTAPPLMGCHQRKIITLKHSGEANMKVLVSTLLNFRQRAIAAGWDGIVAPSR